MNAAAPPTVRTLGTQPYAPVCQAMHDYIAAAATATDPAAQEQVWLLQHPPVYTLGKNGKAQHLLRPNPAIPLIQTDRGGQITYHGPGQLIAYLMLNLRRRQLGLRQLVRALESAVIRFLAPHGIRAMGNPAAPGVYVDGAKIAALGLRVQRGWTCHGISVNIRMDLSPFSAINPCGYPDLRVTQMADLCAAPPAEQLQHPLAAALQTELAALAAQQKQQQAA